MSHSSFDVDEDDLGFIEWLADELVESDNRMLDTLSKIREMSGIDIETIAERMGVAPSEAAEMETHFADPPLSLLRRYALAIGVHLDHHISNAVDRYRESSGRVQAQTMFRACTIDELGVRDQHFMLHGENTEILFTQRVSVSSRDILNVSFAPSHFRSQIENSRVEVQH